MQTITLLEQQKGNQERVNVYLDGAFAFGLNIMDAATLHKGQQLSDADIIVLRHQDAIVKAMDKAVDLLSYRPRSAQEIRQKLAEKDFPEEVIEAAIERLQSKQYLDDRSFARFWIENRIRHKPRGSRALEYELRNKGVDDAIIRELVDELLDEHDAAYEAASARVRRMKGRTQYEFKQKVGAFLQRRGFDYDAANRALDRWIDDLLEEDPAYFADHEAE